MNIQILHSHLLEFLVTKAKPQKIAELLALCGPSVEKIHTAGNDWLYDIEITTNRIDTASVMGIAREAATILPQNGIKASLQKVEYKLPTAKVTKPLSLTIKTNAKLNKRVMAVVMEIGKIEDSPKWMRERLEAAGIRALNNIVDVTNYVMLEVGHPTHVFDFDKIKSHKLVFRLSKKGEQMTTLDNKTYSLPGNDIVIENGDGEIIDLPGIIGTKNSVVNPDTKRIIFFLDNNDPILMRKTSMNLGIRTLAVQLNEKNVDPELGTAAFARGIDLYQKIAGAKVMSRVYDIYPKRYTPKTISLSKEFIDVRIGITIQFNQMKQILTSLGFGVTADKNGKNMQVTVPSFRAHDVDISEDIVEEIARIYGYHNLPSSLMTGKLPEKLTDSPLAFEYSVKTLLAGWGGIEVYNYSLVSKEMTTPQAAHAGGQALRLKNPLGSDTEYLRTSLKPSLVSAAKQNSGEKSPFHIFEMANVYIAQKNNLPQEKLMLAGIFANYDYRNAKGILEALLQKLHITDHKLLSNFKTIGNLYYYEFEVEDLRVKHKDFVAFKPIPKYPAQIEDITLVFSGEFKIGEVLQSIKQIEKIVNVEFIEQYKDAFTFRVWYQDIKKTLTDKEVERIRTKLLGTLQKKFGARVKD